MYSVGDIDKNFQTKDNSFMFWTDETMYSLCILIKNAKPGQIPCGRRIKLLFRREPDFLIVRCEWAHSSATGFLAPNLKNSFHVLLPVLGYGRPVSVMVANSTTGQVLSVCNGFLNEHVAATLCADLLELASSGSHERTEVFNAMDYYWNTHSKDEISNLAYYGCYVA